MKKNKKWLLSIFCLSLVLVFGFTFLVSNHDLPMQTQSNVVYSQENVDETKKLFDFYEESHSDEFTRISAFKEVKGAELSGVENVSVNADEKLQTAYDVQYDHDAQIIYLVVSIFDEQEQLVSAQTMQAFPILLEDGSIDALFDIDGKSVHLSEILSGSNENCFFFTLAMSLFTAKLVAAVIVTAKVVVAVTAVVAVGYATYKVAELTKAKIKEREKVATKAKTENNPKVYYPATRKLGKLLIAASPLTLRTASKSIVTGVDFWSPFDYTAKKLAITASGGYVGPEVDSNKPGYYRHYHLLGRVGGHSFFGTPAGGVY